jgi:hypothetical protein
MAAGSLSCSTVPVKATPSGTRETLAASSACEAVISASVSASPNTTESVLVSALMLVVSGLWAEANVPPWTVVVNAVWPATAQQTTASEMNFMVMMSRGVRWLV